MHRVFVFVFVFVGLAAVVSCSAHADVLIGVSAAMTGRLAWIGEQGQRGAEMAVADLNAAGGVLGQQVRLITVDDFCDPEQAVVAAEKAMRDSGVGVDDFFFRHRAGRKAGGELAVALSDYQGEAAHAYWSDPAPQAMLIDEVEAIWAAIAERDDWAPLHAKLAALKRMGEALGEPLAPAGHRA